MTDEALGEFLETLLRDRSVGQEAGGRALWLVPLVHRSGLVDEVVAVLRQRPDLAIAAGSTLGRLADGSPIGELEQILLDQGLPPESRAGAAYALGGTGKPSVKGALVKALRVPGEHSIVLEYVAEALGYLHGEAKDAVDDIATY